MNIKYKMYYTNNNLILDFLEFQNNLHIYHWTTKSFARHKASDNLYEKMNELVDRFVEVYIGIYSRPTKLNGKLKIVKLSDAEFTNYLESTIIYLKNKLPTYFKETDTDLITIRDDMIASVNQTLYLASLS